MIDYSKRIQVIGKHIVKIPPGEFKPLLQTTKNRVIVKDAGDFKVKDTIHLKEYTGKRYTGRDITAQIRELKPMDNGQVGIIFKKWSVNQRFGLPEDY